jgi:hypothetical protein
LSINALISDTLPNELTYAGPLTLDPPGTTLPDPSGSILASGLTITNGTTITLTFPVTVNTGLAGARSSPTPPPSPAPG